jgi:hypothetical protein
VIFSSTNIPFSLDYAAVIYFFATAHAPELANNVFNLNIAIPRLIEDEGKMKISSCWI